MLSTVDLGVSDDGKGSDGEQTSQVTIPLFGDPAGLPPLECCFGTRPIQAEKSRPERKDLGSAMLATSAIAIGARTEIAGLACSRFG